MISSEKLRGDREKVMLRKAFVKKKIVNSTFKVILVT